MKAISASAPTIATLATLGFSTASFAEICPETGTIVSSDPDQIKEVIYLSPGWHSRPMPMVDLGNSAFYIVHADTFGMACVYDTTTMYLPLFPIPPKKINIAALLGDPKWYCYKSQAPNYPDMLEDICVCSDSRETCTFTLENIQ